MSENDNHTNSIAAPSSADGSNGLDPLAPAAPAIAFIGRSGSGKTVLTEKIIAELTARGLRVGSVKHHGHRGFDIDVPGKDSWRHTQAGSQHTVVVSPDKIASYRTLRRELELSEILAPMTDVDVVVVEGFRHGGVPSIELMRAASPKDAGIASDPEALARTLSAEDTVGVVTDIPAAAAAATDRGLPVFGFDDFAAICDFIEQRLPA